MPANELEKAQLQKLEWEIAVLERQAKEQETTAAAQQEKVKLEIKTLTWQTGRIYRLSQFAIIFSIIATLVTVFATCYGLWASYTKDIENKKKEFAERTDTLYRTEIQRLIQYPVESSKMTISDAVFLFRDLEEVVQNGYEAGGKQDRQKKEMGLLLTQLIKSPDFDLSITRNIEFDREAMTHSAAYSESLIADPRSNMTIISKYQAVLKEIQHSYPEYQIVPDANKEAFFFEYNPPADPAKRQTVFMQYTYIFYAYQSHVQLLGRTADTVPELKELAEEYLNVSFCLFYSGTRSVPLTQRIYPGTADMVQWRWQQCGYAEQKGEGDEKK
jgi:hypothetical protein